MFTRIHGTRRLLVALVGALLLSGALCASAFAVTPKLVGSVSKPYPASNTVETVYAKALDSNGEPVRGIRVTFTWRLGGRVVNAKAWTDRKGVATSRGNVGSSSIWRNHTVAISGRIAGRTRYASVIYVPCPRVSPAHPAQVNIGVAGPFTAGATAFGQGLLRGATLAIDQANAATSTIALGLRFSCVAGDDRGDPRTSVTVARTFMSDARIVGVVGHLNSGCSIPCSKVYADSHVVMISPFSTNPALTQQGLDNVFRTTYTDAFQGPAGAATAGGLGKASAYVVDDSTPYGEGLSGGFAGRFAELGGSVLGTAKTSDRDTDFEGLVAKIKGLNPAIVYYGGVYNAGALFAQQLHDAGASMPVMGGDGLYDPHYIELGGSEVNGDFATSVGYPADALPNGAAFVAAYAAKFPHQDMTDCDPYSYDAANVVISAVIADANARGPALVGSPTDKKRIIKLVAATDAQGVTGRIRFDENGDRLEPKIALFKVVSGVWTYQGLVQ